MHFICPPPTGESAHILLIHLLGKNLKNRKCVERQLMLSQWLQIPAIYTRTRVFHVILIFLINYGRNGKFES